MAGRRKKTLDLLGEIHPDLNSLLDVVFILLIFTMLAMQMGKIKTLSIDLASLEKEGVGLKKGEIVPIYLFEDGRLVVGEGVPFYLESQGKDSGTGNAVSGEGPGNAESWKQVLEARLQKMHDKNILFLVEKKVSYEKFLEVLVAIQKMNPNELQLGVKDKKL